MKQPHRTLNTLNNNQHMIVEFSAELPTDVAVQSYGEPFVTVIDSYGPVLAELVPAPTEGPGRFAFDFVPTVDHTEGEVDVEIEVDVLLVSGACVTLHRTVHFLVLDREGDAIAVTARQPVEQDEATKASGLEALDRFLDDEDEDEDQAELHDALAAAGHIAPVIAGSEDGKSDAPPPPSAEPEDAPASGALSGSGVVGNVPSSGDVAAVPPTIDQQQIDAAFQRAAAEMTVAEQAAQAQAQATGDRASGDQATGDQAAGEGEQPAA